MNTQAHRDRYVHDAIATASPARLLTMLYDRLVRDLNSAELSIAAGELSEANSHLLHAQEIVMELRTSLDTTVWRGGPGLNELYGYIYGELIQANVRKEGNRVQACLKLVEPLRDAWHEAALIAAGGSGVAKTG